MKVHRGWVYAKSRMLDLEVVQCFISLGQCPGWPIPRCPALQPLSPGAPLPCQTQPWTTQQFLKRLPNHSVHSVEADSPVLFVPDGMAVWDALLAQGLVEPPTP